jgi:CheY-like chemotaxis protein
MSLVGNLEDLGLGEILQIVSLSRKSGVLQLDSRDREGRVIFSDGHVIRAMASTFPENLGDLLLRGKMVDIETLKQALTVQQQEGEERRIGDILADEFGVSRESIEQVVREQIERIIYSFFGWDEGSFSFELGDTSELAATSLNPLQFMLDSGLNPQWLAMEGSRIIDEKRHRGEDLDEKGESVVDVDKLLAEVKGEPLGEDAPVAAEDSAPAVETSSEGSVDEVVTDQPFSFLVVDDDLDTAQQLAKLLQERKVQVRVFTNGNSFLDAVRQADPATTILLIDLIMPRTDGSGLLGGLEMLEAVQGIDPGYRALVMSDHPNQEAEESLKALGVPALLPKPKKAEVNEPKGLECLTALVDALVALRQDDSEDLTQPSGMFNIGVELLKELGEAATGLTPPPPQQSPGLHLLRGMLQELNNPSLGGGIILLILRFASELMNRAVIFLVKQEEIVGLGQFGIELQGESADVKVRNTRMPANEESLFSEVIEAMTPAKVVGQDRQWDDYLFGQFGGERPDEVFVGPLVSEGRVVAVLYGDNLPGREPIGDTEALEIFLAQAGLAMEKALLERRLNRNGS